MESKVNVSGRRVSQSLKGVNKKEREWRGEKTTCTKSKIFGEIYSFISWICMKQLENRTKCKYQLST